MGKVETPVIKIAILGPESSGKTTLCRWLAKQFNTVYAHEAVRGYLRRGSRIDNERDLYRAALRQIHIETKRTAYANRVLFCDTELINLKVWSEECFGCVDPKLTELLFLHRYDGYLLTHPDLPWSSDGIRGGNDTRMDIFSKYKKEILHSRLPFLEVHGFGEKRVGKVEKWVSQMIGYG